MKITLNDVKTKERLLQHGDIVHSIFDKGELYLYIELNGGKAIVLDLQNKLQPNSSVIDKEQLQNAYVVHRDGSEYKIDFNLA